MIKASNPLYFRKLQLIQYFGLNFGPGKIISINNGCSDELLVFTSRVQSFQTPFNIWEDFCFLFFYAIHVTTYIIAFDVFFQYHKECKVCDKFSDCVHIRCDEMKYLFLAWSLILIHLIIFFFFYLLQFWLIWNCVRRIFLFVLRILNDVTSQK